MTDLEYIVLCLSIPVALGIVLGAWYLIERLTKEGDDE